jgi:hypothetical protein
MAQRVPHSGLPIAGGALAAAGEVDTHHESRDHGPARVALDRLRWGARTSSDSDARSNAIPVQSRRRSSAALFSRGATSATGRPQGTGSVS